MTSTHAIDKIASAKLKFGSEPVEVSIIGLGNTLMGDDGFGVRAAEALAARDLGEDTRVVVGGVAGMALVGHVQNSQHVIFVDAIDVRDKPGSIYRFDPDAAGVTRLRSNTSHGMGVGYLVTGARMAGCEPNVIVYAAQVADVRPNPDSLSPELEDALPLVIEMIAEEVGRLLGEGEGETPAADGPQTSRPVSQRVAP